MTDAEIVAEIQRGATAAEAALYEKYAPRVYYLALRETRSQNPAEDVRNETFLRVLQAVREDRVRSPQALASFILNTAHNVIREELRKARRVDQLADEDEQIAAHPADDPFLTLEVRQATIKVIRRLKPREREFLRLYYFEELAPAEIAARLGIRVERLRLVKSRALQHFREAYQKLVR